ncbi:MULTISPECIES: DUF4421 domain-containing protein [unclassified Paraflavitalea]|uniref:DUF4421 domain-containing protein n=1 Tax=unclassified Paraflavitalea TaxID=2798305 RepID=UPI003D32893C
MNRFIFVLIIAVFSLNNSMLAQTGAERDSSYVESFDDQLTLRTYLSQKYTIFNVNGKGNQYFLQYRPNTNLNLGLGATYRGLTINLGYGLKFLNKDSDKGTTKYLDLQSHLYGKKWRIDGFGQFYKGYFLFPKGTAASSVNSYYIRPDIAVNELGVSAYYILNHRKYSYRAAFIQDEWQKKSSGSLLVGGVFVAGRVKGDSAFVPSSRASLYEQAAIRYLSYVQAGPGIGYSYTWVYKEHWYATGSGTISIDLGTVNERTNQVKYHTWRLAPDLLIRLVAGYNSADWGLSFSWVSNTNGIRGIHRTSSYSVNTGNYRFTLSRKFIPVGAVKKILHRYDRIIGAGN